jgi:N-alpha-acetyltransferase 35, NatC auxiliary subunit
MAWHLGYPLSQTIFTSVYVEKILMPPPYTIHEANFIRSRDPTSHTSASLVVLNAYCVGMLKACGRVNERIKHEVYYEASRDRHARSGLANVPFL